MAAPAYAGSSRNPPAYSNRSRNLAYLQTTDYDGPRLPAPGIRQAPDEAEMALRGYLTGLSDTYNSGTRIPKVVKRRRTWDSPAFSLLDDNAYDIDPDTFLVD